LPVRYPPSAPTTKVSNNPTKPCPPLPPVGILRPDREGEPHPERQHDNPHAAEEQRALNEASLLIFPSRFRLVVGLLVERELVPLGRGLGFELVLARLNG
jgi:hypothetical protein